MADPSTKARWFTYEDEQELLAFTNDPADPEGAAQKQFRALYTPTPGFDFPTDETAEALDFEVICYIHPNGVKQGNKRLTFHRKIPRGVLRLLRVGAPGGLLFGENLRRAISDRHQFVYVLNYVKSKGWPCAKCSQPCVYVGCKVLFHPPSRLSLPACTPQCGREACRIELQREADSFWKTFLSLAQQEQLSDEGESPAAEMFRDMTLFRGCELCSKSLPDDQMRRCSRCKAAFYCSRDCQKKHWHLRHSRACKRSVRVHVPLQEGEEEI